MGDSIKYRPRKGYARPGEIDISLLEANSPKPRPNAELDPSQKNLAPPGIVEPRPAPLRPAVELNPNRKSLAPAPRTLESKPVAMHVAVEPIPNRTPPNTELVAAKPRRAGNAPSTSLPNVPYRCTESASRRRSRRW